MVGVPNSVHACPWLIDSHRFNPTRWLTAKLSDSGSAANGLKFYQGIVLSSNKRHQSIRGLILRLLPSTYLTRPYVIYLNLVPRKKTCISCGVNDRMADLPVELVASCVTAAAVFALLLLSRRHRRERRGEADAPAEADRDGDGDSALLRVVIVDADNVRATLSWPSRTVFQRRVAHWGSTEPVPTAVILAVDGGSGNSAKLLSPNVVMTTSGRWRADDTIVRDVGWLFANGQSDILVVSSDKLLRKRCRAARMQPGGQRLRFEASEAFAGLLPAIGTAPAPETSGDATPCLARLVTWIVEQHPNPSTAAAERTQGLPVRGRKR